jgi:hypothetical protein
LIPPFNTLQQSLFKDKYFIRTCPWRWLNETSITVHDKNQPRVITLDPWPQIVFLEATGTRTISEFIFYLAAQYAGEEIPAELDVTVLNLINTLLTEQIIELKDRKTSLPPGILKPMDN